MKLQNFILKVLKHICVILLLVIVLLLVVCIMKQIDTKPVSREITVSLGTFEAWCLTTNNEVRHSVNECSSFLLYEVSFTKYIITYNFLIFKHVTNMLRLLNCSIDVTILILSYYFYWHVLNFSFIIRIFNLLFKKSLYKI